MDIGANVGATAVLFANAYPQARIIAFEPAPGTFGLLKSNLDGVSSVETHPHGLFDKDMEATLCQGRLDPVTRSLAEGWETGAGGDIISLKEAAQCFKSLSIDKLHILKIDTEGVECQILASLEERLPGISGGARTEAVDPLEKARELGADYILAKPFSPEGLVNCVEACLKGAPGR